MLDTLVKPVNPIKDYLTEFSGVTAEMLERCPVRLSDVQEWISRFLPPDAILCGHTIDIDLRTLQMSHP